MVTVPLTVNEEEPLAPAVKLNPVVDARVNVPSETESVSESAFVPAAASVIEIALLFAVEKLSELFSFRLPVGGALALGGEFAPKPARLGTFGVTPGVTAGVMGLVTCPWTTKGGLAARRCPRPSRTGVVETPKFRRPDRRRSPVGRTRLRDDFAAASLRTWRSVCGRTTATYEKTSLYVATSLYALRCAKFDRETSKGGPLVPV